ncbi:MAG TPA: endonuclease/exonuclease/phosphatase family protein, partial [Labilithrix sp.]
MALHEGSASGGLHGATGLTLLRERIRLAHVAPARPKNLRVATWNIRQLGDGTRLDESIRMIAAILDAFDVVAIVELRDDLRDMERILAVLGGRWGIVFSDYLRDAGGDRERMAFVFDRERVSFTGLASNAEADRHRVGDRYAAAVPWWRPPFLASFARGSFEFVLVAAHVRWGATVTARRREVRALGDWIAERASEAYFATKDVLLVGDFNLDAAGHTDELALRGLVAPPGLASGVKTDFASGKRYDQILCLPRDATHFTGRAGALDFY